MRISKVKTWSENLELTRPYSISYRTIDYVENVFVYIETNEGHFAIGSGSPAEYVTGESIDMCKKALETKVYQLLENKDPRTLNLLCRDVGNKLYQTPAAQAAIDIALHDLYGKILDMPLVDTLGRIHTSLPTSITIGIKSISEAIAEAEEYLGRGFRILKVKTGKSVDEDVELIRKLRENHGRDFDIRVDANQGYNVQELEIFCSNTEKLSVEFIEQPFRRGKTNNMLELPTAIRNRCAADESLHNPKDAYEHSHNPKAFGIYNIKLMKCGGVRPALGIANIAELAGIDLMWGCMDESIISISAALHAAFASKQTRYLDLDGSLDLARDIVKGGFVLKDGYLSTNSKPGLGVDLIEDMDI
jgi:L-alanine-DL-glutamate epimerase-like enolase superfamily enzyme